MSSFKKVYLFFICFILFYGFSLISQTGSWELKKSENGIKVYTREVANSSFKEIKSSIHLKTSLSSIVALINDRESYPQWVYKCGKSNTIKKISETEGIYYQTVVAPWPVDPRDIVVQVKTSQDPTTKIVKIQSISKWDFIPKVKDHIRVSEFTASWTLIPQKDGTVEVIYQLLVNPGGSVPVWIVNLAAVDGPYETSLKLGEWVKKEKYQKAKFSYIIE